MVHGHDQGLIPVKLLGFDRAVNVTVGLNIVRTSPDHGTAFGIASRHVASPNSMKAAIELAAKLARQPDAREERRRAPGADALAADRGPDASPDA